MSQKENPYTTLWVSRTTSERFKQYKGRGVSADRFLNDLMDKAFQEEEDYSLIEEAMKAEYRSTVLSSSPDEYDEKIAQFEERKKKLIELKEKLNDEEIEK